MPQVTVGHKRYTNSSNALAWPVRSTARVELSAQDAALFFGHAGHLRSSRRCEVVMERPRNWR
jgi:hypothetical protein